MHSTLTIGLQLQCHQNSKHTKEKKTKCCQSNKKLHQSERAGSPQNTSHMVYIKEQQLGCVADAFMGLPM